jgi:UDP-GlcNAc:undecaprenyl-phosphate/decaprenyl-phosphate GlcNAc-1-phosphate transferase
MIYIELSLLAFVVARVAVGVGHIAGLVDRPDKRKTHCGTVPLTGGIAIFVTLLAGMLIFDIEAYTFGMMPIAIMVFAVGVFDDARHINPWIRLGIHYGAGILLATLGGVAIINVGNLLALGPIPLLVLSAPLTALSVAGLANAYNMIDGIDGLAAALVAVPLATLYGLALAAQHTMADFLLLMLVPLSVFLVFNLGPDTRWLPKMFLGDGGSVTLGFLTTASLVYFSQGESAVILPVTALWLVTVPLMDMLATMLRRFRRGQRMMEADNLHLHHTLIDFGLSKRQTLAIMVAYAVITALLGLLLESVPEYISLACYFALFLAHCLFVSNAGAIKNRLSLQRCVDA